MTKNYCVWSASRNREYLRNMSNRAGFMGEKFVGKRDKGKPWLQRKIIIGI
jgi:hypothetical protein